MADDDGDSDLDSEARFRKRNPLPPEVFYNIDVTRMNGVSLLKIYANARHSVGDLVVSIKKAANISAKDLTLLLAFDSKVLDDAKTLEQAGLFDGASVTAIRFPELFFAAAYEDGTTQILSAESGDVQRTFTNELMRESGAVMSVAFAASGLSLVIGCMDGSAHLWSATSGIHMREYIGHTGPVTGVCCSPDGKLLATACFDRTARIWDFVTGRCRKVCIGHRGSVNCVDFSIDSKILGTGSEDSKAKLWSIDDDKKSELTLNGHQGAVQAIAFSPHGKAIATGSLDSDVNLWSTRTGRLEWNLSDGTCPVVSLAFSPDGMIIAVGGTDGTCKLWSVGTGTSSFTLQCNGGVPRSICTVAFSPAGTTLATGSEDGSVSIWGLDNGELSALKRTIQGPSGVFAVSFSAGPVASKDGKNSRAGLMGPARATMMGAH
ncbi:unnamed protein product [Polarella glacialis]|uniref:Ubiquitin-like domain-containing protein n=1 Tax=Polarella glacialis TaxID=89957 RepID=A0A813HYY0_POLGL|nr:unnamed protein product [Polarella glacialis]